MDRFDSARRADEHLRQATIPRDRPDLHIAAAQVAALIAIAEQISCVADELRQIQKPPKPKDLTRGP